jgi:AhpD family alkylhydroperoxidase
MCRRRSGSSRTRGTDIFREGIVDHSVKELCRVYVSHRVKCEYCGNQHSERGREQGLDEGKYDELLNFESSEACGEREKAALAYAEAIVWTGEADDALWERLYAHFSEAELVELGCMIGLTLGQQSWLRLLGIDHHQVTPGTSAAMAPGMETADSLAQSKGSERYWAAHT